jgi:sulfate adenylyltransferase subunit 2
MSNRQRYSHLDALENQSVYIIREAYQKFGNLGLLWSIGKDSSVLLWLLRKAFFGHVPVPCIHVDTGYKLREMIEFRDRLAAEWGLELVVGQNRSALAEGRTYPNGRLSRVECCGALKKDALQAIIEEKGYDAVIVGIRRDEEGTRAKERYFSPRNRNFEWDFKEQPPELWDQFKTDYEPGTHIRVHPLLHWTELNVWEYIDREGIPIVDLYLARNGMRYRSLGCAPCTKPVPSTARSVREIIAELQTTKSSERSTRAQDHESEDAFERLRASGYM